MKQPTISLFGASPTTGNQGVNALCWSTLHGLAQRGYTDLQVFDYGSGRRSARFNDIPYDTEGMTIGKRVWRANHLGVARASAALGFRAHPLVKKIAASGMVLDISGGDSFTDLYGEARFRSIVAPKQLARSLRRPLVLMPQTYGPFKRASSERCARELIADATLAYARDPDSFNRMKALLGADFDSARHRLGVDLAFGLPARQPRSIEPGLVNFLADWQQTPLVGINVSGLLANQPEEAQQRFSLAGDYRAQMQSLVQYLLENTDARILMVPHVHAPLGHYESDLQASLDLLKALPTQWQDELSKRVMVVKQPLDACELKFLIADCDWFCGARMHATIAAVSSGVPTAALAYSLKTRGVFKTCGAESDVIDLRSDDAGPVLDQLIDRWQQRAVAAERLASALPEVRSIASRQLDAIAQCAADELNYSAASTVTC